MKKYAYWWILLCLFILQAVYTLNSLNQIRIEELVTSVRNVYWLENHAVFDGAMTDLGWYAVLLFFYKIFGFHLFFAKFLRLFIWGISLYCISEILKKYFGKEKAWLPLIAIGLSPTVLYLNVLQVQYGIDLEYFPILFYLVARLDFKKKWVEFKEAFLWIGVMIAWMSYPIFVLYIPIIAYVYFKRLKKKRFKKGLVVRNLLISLMAFILPLALGFIWVNNRQLLINDPSISRGIFRSNGSVSLNGQVFADNLKTAAYDFFVKGVSWHFAIYKAEFSDYYPILTVIVVLVASVIIIFRNKRFCFICLFLLSALLFSAIALNLTGESGGM